MVYDFAAIRSRHRLSDVVGKVVNLTKDGHEFRGLCPFHTEKTPSFTVVDERQFFHCFGCGAHGDVVDFVADIHNVDTSAAVRYLEGETPTPAVNRPQKDARDVPSLYAKLKPGDPSSVEPPRPGKRVRVFNVKRGVWVTYQPSMVHPYTDKTGKLIGCVVRIDLSDGKKVTPMLRWCAVSPEKTGWATWPFDKPRPLYVKQARDRTRKVEQVLIVEGEKCADAAASVLPWPVVAWAGGTNNVDHVDWSRLKGRSCLLWPDADAVGVSAMMAIAVELKKIGAGKIKMIGWDRDKPKGWDVADAIAEGWDEARILAWARERVSVPVLESSAPTAERHDGPAPQAPSEATAAPDLAEEKGAAAPPSDHPDHTDNSSDYPFRLLGHSDGRYFYFPSGSQQVVELSPAQHTTPNLLSLYPNIAWWEGRFPQKAKGFNLEGAQTELMDAQQRLGIFDDARIRGRGAWIDRGRAVVNLGDRLQCEGAEYRPTKFATRYVYEAGAPLEIDLVSPASTPDAHKLVKLIDRLTWEVPLSGNLLAGWIVISMVCGALKWRPHIWITGGAHSGKTTVIEYIVKRMIGTIADNADGNSSEAGVRQGMGYDARPVLADEFESEGRRAAERVQQMLQLARGASSGMHVKKGSQSGEAVTYTMRSCFCFSSINTAVAEYADETRISKLVLRPNKDPDAEEHFTGIMATIKELLTPEYAAAMFARTVEHLPTLLKNIDTFTSAAAAHLRNRRAADQVGAMLAGYHLCHSTREISFEDAAAWVKRRTWSEHTAIESGSDELKLLTRIALIKQRLIAPHGAKDFTVGELIQICSEGKTDMMISIGDAERQLGMLGIRCKAFDEHFIVANRSPELSRILEGTPWAKDWVRPLRAIPGSIALEKTYFSSGFKERGTSLPVALLSETLPVAPQPPSAEPYDGCSDDGEIPT